MYELFIILYNIGVWVASFFSKKVRTMWKGEHQTFRVLREKIRPQRHVYMVPRGIIGRV